MTPVLRAQTGAINTFSVDGLKYPLTADGIQAAINDACSLGATSVFIPSVRGGIVLNGTLPITINSCPLSLHIYGPQGNASLIVPCSVSTSSDVVQIRPPMNGLLQAMEIDHLSINPASGCSSPPGRYAIGIVANGGTFGYNSSIHDIQLGQFGGGISINISGSSPEGTIALSSIHHNRLCNGIQIANAGDSVDISYNRITDVYSSCSGFSSAGVNITSYQPGASSTWIHNNNVTTKAGCVKLAGSVVAGRVSENECEDAVGATGADDSEIDLAGGAGSLANIIADNSIQVVHVAGLNNIRVVAASGTVISGNNLEEIGSTPEIILARNASHTLLRENYTRPGTTRAQYLIDSGTNTYGVLPPTVADGLWQPYNTAVLLNNGKPLESLDDMGVARAMIQTDNQGRVAIFGYHGATMLEGVNGATYLWDGGGKRAVTINSNQVSIATGALPAMTLDVGGAERIRPTAVSGLPNCNSSNEGTFQPVNDSTTSAWGAAVTPGGSNHVLAYCDGTSWTVAAK